MQPLFLKGTDVPGIDHEHGVTEIQTVTVAEYAAAIGCPVKSAEDAIRIGKIPVIRSSPNAEARIPRHYLYAKLPIDVSNMRQLRTYADQVSREDAAKFLGWSENGLTRFVRDNPGILTVVPSGRSWAITPESLIALLGSALYAWPNLPKAQAPEYDETRPLYLNANGDLPASVAKHIGGIVKQVTNRALVHYAAQNNETYVPADGYYRVLDSIYRVVNAVRYAKQPLSDLDLALEALRHEMGLDPNVLEFPASESENRSTFIPKVLEG